MSNLIITDYMAGQIGDEYYETVGEGCEYVGRIDDIDHNDDDLRYHLEPNKKDLRWRYKDAFDHFEREVTDEESESDEGMERITDITQVRPGDTEVTKSGNQYKVIKANYLGGFLTLRVAIPESLDGEMWLHDSAFAYALRPKPEVPTDPGLYLGNDGNIWMLDVRGRAQKIVNGSEYLIGCYIHTGGLPLDLHPYTHITLERES